MDWGGGVVINCQEKGLSEKSRLLSIPAVLAVHDDMYAQLGFFIYFLYYKVSVFNLIQKNYTVLRHEDISRFKKIIFN